MSCGLPPPSLPPLHLSSRFMSSTATGEVSCLIRRLVACFSSSSSMFFFSFLNTFVHGRWFSVYSSCGAEQMDTGWHLRITPRNHDLLQSPCPSFFGAATSRWVCWDSTNCCSFVHTHTVPAKPPVSPTHGLSGAKEKEGTIQMYRGLQLNGMLPTLLVFKYGFIKDSLPDLGVQSVFVVVVIILQLFSLWTQFAQSESRHAVCCLSCLARH